MLPLEAFAGRGATSPSARGVPRLSWPWPQLAASVAAPARLQHIPSAGAVQAPGAADPQTPVPAARQGLTCSVSPPSGTDPQNLAVPHKTGLTLANAERLQMVSSERCWCSALFFQGSALPAYPGIAACFAPVVTPTLQTPRAPISGSVRYSEQLLKSQRCRDGPSPPSCEAPCHRRHLDGTESTVPTHLWVKITRGL